MLRAVSLSPRGSWSDKWDTRVAAQKFVECWKSTRGSARCLRPRPNEMVHFYSAPFNIVELRLGAMSNGVNYFLRILNGVKQSLIAIKHSCNKVVFNNIG